MALSKIFPVGLNQLPFLWLSLPDLMRRKGTDPEVAEIFIQPDFWARRLQEEYGVISQTKDPLEEYAHYYLPHAIRDGFLFELAHLGLTLTEDEQKLISQSRERFAYVTGVEVAGYEEKLTLKELKIRWRSVPNTYAKLHQGDEKDASELRDRISIGIPILRVYTERMIDNAIRFGIGTPNMILGRLTPTAQFPFNRKNIILLEYLLCRYGKALTEENRVDAIIRLEYLIQRENDGLIIADAKEAQELLH
jgi:hypothetical protein